MGNTSDNMMLADRTVIVAGGHSVHLYVDLEDTYPQIGVKRMDITFLIYIVDVHWINRLSH